MDLTFYSNGWCVAKDMAEASAGYRLIYLAGHLEGGIGQHAIAAFGGIRIFV